MRQRRFSDEPLVGILQEQAAGERPGVLGRRHGISAQTRDRWNQKDDGWERHEGRRLKALAEENARLKRLGAEQALANHALHALLRKNWCGPLSGGRRWSPPRRGSGSPQGRRRGRRSPPPSAPTG
jgi:putative transposase